MGVILGLVGALLGAVLFCLGFYLGASAGFKREKPEEIPEDVKIQRQEQLERIKEENEAMQQLLNYSVDVPYNYTER